MSDFVGALVRTQLLRAFFGLFLVFSFFSGPTVSAQICAQPAVLDGENVCYTYDDLGRLTKAVYAKQAIVYSYSYDKSGNRTTSTVGGVSIPQVVIFNNRILEGGGIWYELYLRGDATQDVMVDWAVVGGTATFPDDYSNNSGSVTILENTRRVAFKVQTLPDDLPEGDETVLVQISNAQGAFIVVGDKDTAVGTIRDDDVAYFQVDDVSLVAEGDSVATVTPVVINKVGGTDQTITVTLSAYSVSATNGAVSGEDFDPVFYSDAGGTIPVPASQLAFAPTDVSKTVYVKTLADQKFEQDEYFYAHLDFVSNGTFVSTERGAVNIPNDDVQPTVKIGNAGNREGNSIDFSVWMTNNSYQPVTLTMQVADTSTTNIEGYPSATQGTDYDLALATVAPGSGVNTGLSINGDTLTYTIEPDVNGFTLSVPSTTDTDVEGGVTGYEAFYVKLSSVVDGFVDATNSEGRGRIRDDDTDITVTIANAASVAEGDTVASALSFPVTLSAEAFADTTVNWAVTGGTAVLDTDFTGPTSGIVTIPMFGTTANIDVLSTVPNTLFSGDQTIEITLSVPVNAVLGAGVTASGTIIEDDETPPSFSVSGMNVTEGGVLTYTITKTGTVTQPYSVNYSTALGSAEAADISGGLPSGPFTFAAADITKTVTIQTVDDTDWEQRETVILTLSGATGAATITTATAEGGIGNNDGEPIINAFNNGQPEGNVSNALPMTIFLQGGTQEPVTLTYQTTDGTALAGSDYVAIPPTPVTIQPGSFEHTFNVTVLGDATVESDEYFNVIVSNVTGGRTVTTGINAENPNKGTNGVGNINNDDYTYSWSTGSYSYSGSCSASGQLGTRSVVCKRVQDNATVNDINCGGGKPTSTTTRSCTKQYSYGVWGSWQGACGGTQTAYRSVTCTWSPAGNSCGTSTDSKTRTCNIKTYSNSATTWGVCSSSGTRTGSYVRTCTWSPSGSSCGSETIATSGTCTPPTTYSWNTGTWSSWACTGVGSAQKRTRSVTCRASTGGTVSNSNCSGTMPSTSEVRVSSTCGGVKGF